jgi:hypothetical protein
MAVHMPRRRCSPYTRRRSGCPRGAARLGNVRAYPWLALSILEGEHDTHAAVLTEGPAEVVATVPDQVRSITEMRNRGGSLDWATAWLRMTPQRLFSFAEVAWQGVAALRKHADRIANHDAHGHRVARALRSRRCEAPPGGPSPGLRRQTMSLGRRRMRRRTDSYGPPKSTERVTVRGPVAQS